MEHAFNADHRPIHAKEFAMTPIQEKVKVLQSRIFQESYHIRLWNDTLIVHQMVPSGIDEGKYTDKQLVFMCHQMWEELPDDKTIRRGPFFALCDVAEHIFD